MSDKPMTATLAEAQELTRLAAQSKTAYRLTYTYTGYPLVREARRMVAAGVLGAIRKVVVEYSQGWLATAVEKSGTNKQAEWRADPKRSGEGGCIGDIGVHAFNLAEFVSGRQVKAICADLNSMVAGRVLDDDCNILLRFDNGAPGVLVASQIEIGGLNGLRLRVYGEKASLDWSQESPNRMAVNYLDGRCEWLGTGSGLLGADAQAATRLPMGHPEGYLEAFANLYRDFAKLLRGEGKAELIPGAEDGLRGMTLISTAVNSSRAGGGWTPLSV
jgi:predicted dehydrogenase